METESVLKRFEWIHNIYNTILTLNGLQSHSARTCSIFSKTGKLLKEEALWLETLKTDTKQKPSPNPNPQNGMYTNNIFLQLFTVLLPIKKGDEKQDKTQSFMDKSHKYIVRFQPARDVIFMIYANNGCSSPPPLIQTYGKTKKGFNFKKLIT